jgi:hypothetical protein
LVFVVVGAPGGGLGGGGGGGGGGEGVRKFNPRRVPATPISPPPPHLPYKEGTLIKNS